MRSIASGPSSAPAWSSRASRSGARASSITSRCSSVPQAEDDHPCGVRADVEHRERPVVVFGGTVLVGHDSDARTDRKRVRLQARERTPTLTPWERSTPVRAAPSRRSSASSWCGPSLSLTLPAADVRSFTFDPVGARIEPDDARWPRSRPTGRPRRSTSGEAIIPRRSPRSSRPTVGTRAALLWVYPGRALPHVLDGHVAARHRAGPARATSPLRDLGRLVRVVDPAGSIDVEGRSIDDDVRGVDRTGAVPRERGCRRRGRGAGRC